MADPATRVALLARPGAACDNLQAALRQLGAEVVAVQDPADGDPAAVAAARPAAVLVALEPALEEALERYDAVLSEPGRLVIYDEVAVAARREGWDAARWARHLAAKLGGHADVLPPGAGADEDAPVAAPRARAQAPQPAPVPVPQAVPGPEPEPEVEPEVASASGPPAFDIDFDEATDEGFDAGDVHLGLEPGQEEALARAGEGIDFGGFTPEMLAAMALEPVSASEATPGPEAAADAPTAAVAADDALSLEWDAPAPATEVAPEAPAHASAPQPEPQPQPQPAPDPAPAPVRFSADDMALVDIEPAVKAASPRSGGFAGESGEGGVVVLAGIGGPDAVRQFLGALPAGFARPIVVRQRLDGGRHDRLVRQMQRATALPVELAEAGRPLVAGHVYILPEGMSTAAGDGATAFVATDAPVPALAGMAPSDSAVLVLSGSDPAAVPELLDAARDGALVLGQSPEESFDGAAAAALVAAGGESRNAAELAQRLSTRWLSLKD
jgi:chemosensory pili system protein ChpB (putative protein-glutamate methylesterase)